MLAEILSEHYTVIRLKKETDMNATTAVAEKRKENEVLQARVAQCLKAREPFKALMKGLEIAPGSTNEFMVTFPLFDAVAEAMEKGVAEAHALAAVGLTQHTAGVLASRHPTFMMTMRKARYSLEVYRDTHGVARSKGRPSTYTPVKAQFVVAALRKGLAVIDAAHEAGTTVHTILAWRRANKDFDKAVASAILERKPYTRRGARPPQCIDTFDQELAALIVDDVAKGRSIVDICKAEDMPAASTVYRWMKRHGEFAIAIEQAKRRRS